MQGLVWAMSIVLVLRRIHPIRAHVRYLAGSSAGSADVSMKMEYSM